jgi:hypothetical protein
MWSDVLRLTSQDTKEGVGKTTLAHTLFGPSQHPTAPIYNFAGAASIRPPKGRVGRN